jgi:nucleotide-binding universal stress UspA family protein
LIHDIPGLTTIAGLSIARRGCHDGRSGEEVAIMAIRKILVPVDGSDAVRSALQTAVDLAGALPAHIEALHVRVAAAESIGFIGEGMSGEVLQEMIEATNQQAGLRAEAAKAMAEGAFAAAGLPLAAGPEEGVPSGRWLEMAGQEEEVVVTRGRLADLIVMPRPIILPEVLSTASFHAALFESGRPILVAGREGAEGLHRRAGVAWNASREAARAIGSALPLLAGAESVAVFVHERERHGAGSGADLVEYLAWHGIRAGIRPLSDRKPPEQALIEACDEIDFLVMGAYTHSRLRELILGGVTRHMLEHANLPLLMAH